MTVPRDREHDLARLLGDDGGEFGMLYRRLPRDEPPRRLDRAVLGEAARAVRGQTPRRHRWMVGLGSAAGIVLAAGIAWHVGQDALREQSQDVGRFVPVEPITESASRKHAPEAAVETQDAAASPAPAAMPVQIPAKPATPALAHRPAAKAAPQAQVRPTAAPPAPAIPVQPPVAFPAEPAQRQEVPQTATPQAGAAAGSVESAAQSAHASDALDQAMPQRIRGSGPPSPSSSVELRRDTQLAPDEWLAHIQQLLDQGRRQQALESLRLFRSAHPKRPLPDALQALLE